MNPQQPLQNALGNPRHDPLENVILNRIWLICSIAVVAFVWFCSTCVFAADASAGGPRLAASRQGQNVNIGLTGTTPGYYSIHTSTNLVTWVPAGVREMLQDGWLMIVTGAPSPRLFIKAELNAAPVGTVVAWGDNSAGQTTVPADLSGVTVISAGGLHTVALKSDGTVVAWGDNSAGQTTVPGRLSGVTAIAAGHLHTVALKSDGTVVAWGDNGDGQTTIPGLNGTVLTGVKAIAAGRFHTVALTRDGKVVAWGDNRSGQTTVPTGLSGVTAISAGTYYTVVLKGNGTVVAWGASGTATGPAGLTGVKAIAAGGNQTVALKGDGSVVAWGFNGEGQTNVPVGLSGVTAIAAGGQHTVAVGVAPPSITAQPVSQTVNTGQNVSFTVTLTGTVPLIYQWMKDGTNVIGATAAALTLSNVQTNQAGNYSVVATNAYGRVTSSLVVLTVNRLAQTITFGALAAKRVDDAPFTLNAGTSSGLSVSYTSSNPGVAIVNGNTVTITGVGSTTISAIQAGDATYLPAAIVRQALNVAGIPPGIISQPQSLVVNVNSNAAFNVTATGTAPLSYQWRKDGSIIAGATTRNYSIPVVQASDAGGYTVLVSNAAGSVISQIATLAVNTPLPPQTAPDSLAGLTVRVSSSSGPYRWIAAPAGSKYVVFPDSSQNGTSGSYSYSKSGTNLGAITVTDYRAGQINGSITFTSATAGTVSLGIFSGPFTIEETTAPNASLALNTIAGKTISAAIIDARGVFSPAGGYTVAVQSNGSSYSLTALGFVGNSNGSLTYSKLTAATASVNLTDSLVGSVTGNITWYSATRGELSFSRPDGAWQYSVFQLQ